MITNHIPRPLLVGVLKCASTLISITALAVTAAAQTNTFPSSGNAGVGTTTPNSPLTVVGNVGAEANTSFNSGVGLLGLDTSNGYLQLYDSTRTMKTYFSSRAGVNGYINNGGNFGIGTTNPQWGRLQVNKIIRIDDDSASPNGSDTMMAAPMLYLGTSTGGNAFQFNGGGGLDLWQYNNATWGRTVTFAKTGYVGIGLTVPLYSLDVNGGVNAFRAKASSTNANDTIATFENSSGIAAIVRANGNVGIGTTSPGALLHVNGNAGLLTSGTGGILAFQMRDGGMYGGLYGTGNVMRLWRADAGDVMGINSSGNVGIGTVSPSYKLDVAGQVRSSSGGFVFPDGTVQTTAGSGGGSSQWSNNGVGINYSSGRVGISNGNPGSLLYVGSGSVAAGPLPGINVATGAESYVAASDGTRTAFLGADASGYGMVGTLSNHDFVVRSNNAERIRVSAAGNVGIGTASPTDKLHVSGNGKVTGNFTVDGTINAKYQDVAEWVLSAEELAAATVVVLDPTKENQVISSTVAYDTRVAGVISEQPGISLGESGDGKVLVATTGRVRVKVDASRGPIQIGDLLVTSDIPGVAMRSDPVEFAGRKMHMPGTIIGKALAPLPKGRGEILVLLSLQ